ncbi:IS66 family transposase zinc-finger binding domain-containing protein [Variovorax sp. GrIS 2.14]|uniref:IS66 family transposase zinc-finger binding domain-containing protein n=1 Tax=Variovorax sp. GrIS 2.14 TaxID=3071709 RepID=UPI0038F79D94
MCLRGLQRRAALFGQDVAEVLEIVPARFVVIRHVRPKYTCTKCHTSVCTGTPATAGTGGATKYSGVVCDREDHPRQAAL